MNISLQLEDEIGMPQLGVSSANPSPVTKSVIKNAAVAKWLETHCFRAKVSRFSNTTSTNTPSIKKGMDGNMKNNESGN